MIKTVGDLQDALAKFNRNMPVVYRKGEGDGAVSDWKLHNPEEFYPGGRVCLSAFEQVEDGQAQATN